MPSRRGKRTSSRTGDLKQAPSPTGRLPGSLATTMLRLTRPGFILANMGRPWAPAATGSAIFPRQSPPYPARLIWFPSGRRIRTRMRPTDFWPGGMARRYSPRLILIPSTGPTSSSWSAHPTPTASWNLAFPLPATSTTSDWMMCPSRMSYWKVPRPALRPSPSARWSRPVAAPSFPSRLWPARRRATNGNSTEPI